MNDGKIQESWNFDVVVRETALNEVSNLIALVDQHPEYRPDGLRAGLCVVRGLLAGGLSPEQWGEVQSYFSIPEGGT